MVITGHDLRFNGQTSVRDVRERTDPKEIDTWIFRPPPFSWTMEGWPVYMYSVFPHLLRVRAHCWWVSIHRSANKQKQRNQTVADSTDLVVCKRVYISIIMNLLNLYYYAHQYKNQIKQSDITLASKNNRNKIWDIYTNGYWLFFFHHNFDVK